jgi:hypothetical protein
LFPRIFRSVAAAGDAAIVSARGAFETFFPKPAIIVGGIG